MKKILSIALSVIIALSCCCISVFATVSDGGNLVLGNNSIELIPEEFGDAGTFYFLTPKTGYYSISYSGGIDDSHGECESFDLDADWVRVYDQADECVALTYLELGQTLEIDISKNYTEDAPECNITFCGVTASCSYGGDSLNVRTRLITGLDYNIVDDELILLNFPLDIVVYENDPVDGGAVYGIFTQIDDIHCEDNAADKLGNEPVNINWLNDIVIPVDFSIWSIDDCINVELTETPEPYSFYDGCIFFGNPMIKVTGKNFSIYGNNYIDDAATLQMNGKNYYVYPYGSYDVNSGTATYGIEIISNDMSLYVNSGEAFEVAKASLSENSGHLNDEISSIMSWAYSDILCVEEDLNSGSVDGINALKEMNGFIGKYFSLAVKAVFSFVKYIFTSPFNV